MAESRHVTGKISTNKALSLSGCEIMSGKWTNGPSTSIAADVPNVRAFEARGRKDSATGAEGWVEYSTTDNAKFRLYFDDPYTNANQATISGVSGPFQSYDYSVEFPTSGSEWEVRYKITKKQPATG